MMNAFGRSIILGAVLTVNGCVSESVHNNVISTSYVEILNCNTQCIIAPAPSIHDTNCRRKAEYMLNSTTISSFGPNLCEPPTERDVRKTYHTIKPTRAFTPLPTSQQHGNDGFGLIAKHRPCEAGLHLGHEVQMGVVRREEQEGRLVVIVKGVGWPRSG